MNNKASMTSLMSAFGRAYVSENSINPIFNDNFAKKLLSDEEYQMIKSHILQGVDFLAPEKKNLFKTDEEIIKFIVETQIAPTPIARSKFCEDSLKTAISTGTEQYVILGAGLDTFAFREKDLMKNITVYEVDHPSTQKDKIERIKRAKLEIPENLIFVSMDFIKDNLKDKLIESGFDANKKTFFSWLGVSYYLTENQVENLFENISSFASDGSTLLFDYADDDIFSSDIKRVKNMIAMADAAGEPMKFCAGEFDIHILLDRNNFLVYEMLSSNDIENQYFCNRNDYLSAFEHISYCLAVLKGKKIKNTKDAILLTALKLFSLNGFKAVSVRDIAGEIGITQAALYKHFKNKQDIFDKILDKMEQNDAVRAKEYFVPEKEYTQTPQAYKSTQLDKFCTYTKAQFKYWTEDEFASSFRKMLVLEKYKSNEISALYSNYLVNGPLGYVRDLFKEIFPENMDAKQLALDFYAPFYFLIELYDNDSKNAAKLLDEHINQFFKKEKCNDEY